LTVGQLVALDSSVLGVVTRAPGDPEGDDLFIRLANLRSDGVPIIIPEIADYEVRRGLMVARATSGLKRLDALKSEFTFRAIRSADMRRAAELWAYLARRGLRIAGHHDLGADAILTAQAIHAGRPGDEIRIVTDNLRHFGRFPGVTAVLWRSLRR
jgi:predicted nucleic acid-binding protein